jgi:ParB/RepB/Spo0J family partition protein
MPEPVATPFQMIPIDEIRVFENYRKHFDPQKLEELAQSIRTEGVLQPIGVRPAPSGQGFDLRFGERRWRAAKKAGLTAIPSIVRVVTDEQILEEQLVENGDRDDVSELEEGEAYKRLHEKHGRTIEHIMELTGKSRAQIYARMKLTALQGAPREALLRRTLSGSIALLLARIPTQALQAQAFRDVTEGGLGGVPMSVRAAAEHIQDVYMLDLEKAEFPIADPQLVPAAGSCASCPKRSGNQRELEDAMKAVGVPAQVDPRYGRGKDFKPNPNLCTDRACYETKRGAFVKLRIEQAKKAGQVVLSKTDAKAVFPYEHGQIRSEKYVDLSEDVHHAGGKAHKLVDLYKKAEKRLKAEAPLPILAQDPKGRLHEILPKAELGKVLRAAGVAVREESPRDPAMVRFMEQKRKLREAEKRQAKITDDAIVAMAQTIRSGERPLPVPDDEWKMLAVLVASDLVVPSQGFDPDTAAQRYGFVNAKDLEARIAEAPPLAHKTIVFEALVRRAVGYGGAPGSEVRDMFRYYGVDLKKIAREVDKGQAKAEKKAKPKAKPKKKRA